MDIIAGLITLVIAFALVLVLGMRKPPASVPLLAAFACRVSFIALNNTGLFSVPGSGSDAPVFLNRALEWSRLGWPELWNDFSFSHSYMYSWLGAVLFKVTVPSPLMFQAFNLVLGIVVCYSAYVVADALWGSRRAVIAIWLCALFPFAIFNSVITLREEISIMFFMIGMFFVVNWVRGNHPLALIGAFGGLSVATLFHGGWAAAAIAFGAVVIRETILPGDRKHKPRNDAFSVLSALLIMFAVLFLAGNEIQLSSRVGNPFEKLSGGVVEDIEVRFGEQQKALGGSAYPAFVLEGKPFTQPWVLPLRIAYFLFSPFPWDIQSLRHLGGIIGALAFYWLFWQLWRLRWIIWTDRTLQALCLIAAALILVFAIGTSNVGTSLRHRTKAFALLATIAVGACYRDPYSPQDIHDENFGPDHFYE